MASSMLPSSIVSDSGTISLDENFRPRVVDPEVYARSQELCAEVSQFSTSEAHFPSLPLRPVHTLSPSLSSRSIRWTDERNGADVTELLSAASSAETVIGGLAKQIEEEKLRAIGLRNHLDQQTELRRKRTRELEALIAERKAHLERKKAELEFLEKVEKEQRSLLDKLTNSPSSSSTAASASGLPTE